MRSSAPDRGESHHCACSSDLGTGAAGWATGQLRESATDDIDADLDGCGGEGGHGDEDGGAHAIPVREFVWMTRLSAAFADVTKHGSAAFLKAAPAPEGDAAARPLERLQPGAFAVATLEGRETYLRVLKYYPEGVATGGGKFDMRGLNTSKVYVGENALAACDVSFFCVRDATTAGRSELSLREFPAVDASRALGLIVNEVGHEPAHLSERDRPCRVPCPPLPDSWLAPPLPVILEDCVVTALTADSPFAPPTSRVAEGGPAATSVDSYT